MQETTCKEHETLSAEEMTEVSGGCSDGDVDGRNNGGGDGLDDGGKAGSGTW